jgi:hypothetical protein
MGSFMINNRWYRSAVLAVSMIAAAGVAAAALFTVASAQSRRGGILGPQATEISRAPYQEYVPFANPDSTASPFKLDFAPVPRLARLDVSNVSCYIASQYGNYDGAEIEYVQLLLLDPHGELVTASTLAPVPVSTKQPRSSAGAVTWAVNNAVSVFAPARHKFQILLGTAPNNYHYLRLACHISGQMVRLG